LTGSVALASEVIWTRYLGLLVHNTVHTYTLTLAAVLVGLAFGSLVATRLFDGRLGSAETFGWLQCVSAVVVMAVVHLPPALWRALGTDLPILFVLILPASALGGASFPLAVRLATRDPRTTGLHVGRLAALNVLGGIAGSLAMGFVALPRLGLHASVLLVTGTSLAVGVAACLLGTPPAERRRGAAVALAAGLAWVVVPRLLATRLPEDFLGEGRVLIDVREGLTSNIAVLRADGLRHLEMDRWWQGQSARNHQVVAAHLPMLLHPAPRRVMVVGVGAGQTAARFLLYDVERLDCVDIEPALFAVLRADFDAVWMDDPRVRLLHEDGRNVLLHTAERYDVVSLELGQIFRPGVESLYTRDFYAGVAARLLPGGVVAQFVPLPLLDLELLRSVVRTFVDVFPESVLWYNTSELLLLGSRDAPLVLGERRLRLLEDAPSIRDDLRYSYWDGAELELARPAVLAGGFLAGPTGLAALAGDAPALRDDRPVLAYAAAAMLGREAEDETLVAALGVHLDPIGSVLEANADPAVAREATTIRDMNLGDLVVAARLRRVEALRRSGDYPAIFSLLTQALTIQPRHATARRMLGDTLVYLGRLDEAREVYEQVLALRPEDALAHRGLGTASLLANDPATGVPHLRTALELRPEDGEAHNSLGVALARQGDLAGAARHFAEAVALRPADPEARRNLELARGARAGP
jgi:spermidine synthase